MTDVVARIDDIGMPAWIGLMVVAFFLFPPLGLAILAFLLWSGRMGCRRSEGWGGDPRERWQRKIARMQEKLNSWGKAPESAQRGPMRSPFPPTGNAAFDDYRAETLRRLEQEAEEFRSYLQRLRHAKDKAEFDQFIAERRNQPPAGPDPTPPAAA